VLSFIQPLHFPTRAPVEHHTPTKPQYAYARAYA
jgi:hypothetical protein